MSLGAKEMKTPIIVTSENGLSITLDSSGIHFTKEDAKNLAIQILQAQGWIFEKIGSKERGYKDE